MKKWIAVLLILCLTLPLFACDYIYSGYYNAVEFFYLQKDLAYGKKEGVISSEIREAGHGKNLDRILKLYLLGPLDDDLTIPFPKGTSVVSLEIHEEGIYIALNEVFATLSGIELTTACICIAKTCFAVSEAQSIHISVPGKLLDGAKSIVLTPSDMHLFDDSASYADPIK
jgi:hypothetical protein